MFDVFIGAAIMLLGIIVGAALNSVKKSDDK